MMVYALKRAVLGLAIMLTISMAVFALTNIASDPAIAIAGEGATATDVEAVRQRYGFDRPVVERYAEWLGHAVRGDFGMSYRQQRPVARVVLERFPVTFTLACLALGFSLALALPLAMFAALWPNSMIDRFAVLTALVAQAVPTFWLSLLGILVFSVELGWLPVSGSTSFVHYILPAACLGFFAMPAILRLTRAGLLEVLEADYIRTARAKGLRTPTILVKHALRNAIIPVVSIASVQFGYLLSGSVIVETIFAMQGIGYLAWESVSSADLPVVQALVLVTAFFYVLLTLFADILNAWLDPRIRIA
ncbi:ABC transporter permease [Microvirga antarctica]|uniref:ABC transporter permease n=1 Tax=Microvirga antarctica TaxID=2819233 RepID=UPI001B313D40|nr:ABC transporter permease [Microvirga antarctica]